MEPPDTSIHGVPALVQPPPPMAQGINVEVIVEIDGKTVKTQHVWVTDQTTFRNLCDRYVELWREREGTQGMAITCPYIDEKNERGIAKGKRLSASKRVMDYANHNERVGIIISTSHKEPFI